MRVRARCRSDRTGLLVLKSVASVFCCRPDGAVQSLLHHTSPCPLARVGGAFDRPAISDSRLGRSRVSCLLCCAAVLSPRSFAMTRSIWLVVALVASTALAAHSSPARLDRLEARSNVSHVLPESNIAPRGLEARALDHTSSDSTIALRGLDGRPLKRRASSRRSKSAKKGLGISSQGDVSAFGGAVSWAYGWSPVPPGGPGKSLGNGVQCVLRLLPALTLSDSSRCSGTRSRAAGLLPTFARPSSRMSRASRRICWVSTAGAPNVGLPLTPRRARSGTRADVDYRSRDTGLPGQSHASASGEALESSDRAGAARQPGSPRRLARRSVEIPVALADRPRSHERGREDGDRVASVVPERVQGLPHRRDRSALVC